VISWRTGTAALAAAALLAGLAGCSDPGAEKRGDPSLTIGAATEPDTLSPLLGYGKDGNSKIFDGLLQRNRKLELEPALATALPEVSQDGLTYTYTLRQGVKFSDGTPFTAADVVFTYETILDEKTSNGSRDEIAAVESVTAEGDHTVVFELKYPYAPFVERTVLPIASQKAASGQDVNTGAYNTSPVGTGPYVLESWRKGEQMTLKANPGCWGGAPEVKSFTTVFIADDDVRATRLRAGELDGAALPPSLARTFENVDGTRLITAESVDYRAVTLPTGNPVAGDKAIRQALNLAVDRELMVESILKGAGRPAYNPLPENSPWFAPEAEVPHDDAKAARILDSAGWKSEDGGIREKDGRRASFKLWYPSGDKLRQDHALAYASEAKEVGVEVKVQAGTWEVIEPVLGEDAVLAGGGAGFDPDFDLYSTLHSGLIGNGWNNMGHYTDPGVDEALETGRKSNDEGERRQAYSTVQRLFADDPGYTYLTHIDHVYVVSDEYEGLTTQLEPHDHGMGGPWWNLQDWTLPQ